MEQVEHLMQQVQQAYRELSALAHGSTSADIVMSKLTAYELAQLRERIDEAILKRDQQELQGCLDRCKHLQASIRAVRKMVEHDAHQEIEENTP